MFSVFIRVIQARKVRRIVLTVSGVVCFYHCLSSQESEQNCSESVGCFLLLSVFFQPRKVNRIVLTVSGVLCFIIVFQARKVNKIVLTVSGVL